MLSPESVLEKYDRTIHKVARKYYMLNSRFSYDDLVSEAKLVAIKAISTYDESKAAFITYLTDALDTEIKKFVRNNRYDLTVSEYEQREEYCKSGSTEKINREATASVRFEHIYDGAWSPIESAIPSGYPSPDQILEHIESVEVLRDELAQLPDRERTVINLRWFENMTLGDIANSLKISKQAAHNWEKSGLEKLSKRVRERLGE